MDAASYVLAKKFAAKNYGNRYVRALGNRLTEGIEPACLLLQGDSTGNEVTDWFYLAMQKLAVKYPGYTFQQRLWNHTHQNYSGAVNTIQTGSNGDAYSTTTVDAGWTLNDAEALRITGDLDVIVKVAATDWTPGMGQVLASKFGNAGDRGWALGVSNTSGKINLWWSANGTDLLGGEGSALESSVAPTIADGSPLWIRCTLDVDNGASGHDIKYYTSSDGATWTQLGTTRTGVGTTSIFASTATMNVGRRAGGGGFVGKVYRAIIRSGIDGKIIASPDAGLGFPPGTTTMKDAEGNTWTIPSASGVGSPMVLLLNSSCAGQGVAYSADVARFALQTPIEPQLSFINYSHNEADAEVTYQTEVEALATALLTKYTNTGVVCVTQNPQHSPRTVANINAHAIRNRQIALTAAKNDYGLIDCYRAIAELNSIATYVQGDGVHPTVAGFSVWANEAYKFLLPAML
jgi:hypothetical protein